MLRSILGLFALSLLIASCSEPGDKDAKPRKMVYEGMSATELREVLGEPMEIENQSEIFDAQTMTKMSMEHWVYEKRIVLLINDTVKNPNLN